MLRFFGNNFDRSKNLPPWISFTYDAAMSWFGTENAGSCGDSVLSQSGFGSPGEVACLGGSVAPVGFVSLCGVVPTATEFWFRRAVMVAWAASVAISQLDSATLLSIMVLSISSWSAEKSCKLPRLCGLLPILGTWFKRTRWFWRWLGFWLVSARRFGGRPRGTGCSLFHCWLPLFLDDHMMAGKTVLNSDRMLRY